MTSAAGTTPAALSVSARLDRLPACRYLASLAARIALGGWFEFYELFIAGYIALGLISSGLFHKASTGYFDWSGFAAFTGTFFAGMFVSTVFFSRIPDRYGRKSTFTASMVFYSVAAVLVAFSPTAGWIDVWRFVAGFGIGIQLINNDSFISEMAPKQVRGRYMALGFIVILTSIPVVALLAWALVPRAPLGLDGWRWVMLIGAAGGVLVWLLRRGLPESPRWLASKGRIAEADAVVTEMERRVVAQTGHALPAPAAVDVAPAAEQGSWREVFGRRYGGRTLMLSVFQFAQTIGVYGFSNWVVILLATRGYTVVTTLGYSFVIACFTPVGGLVAWRLAERFERKWQLVAAAAGIGIFGIIFAEARVTALLIACGAAVTVCNNWLIGIFHTYGTELFPTRIRARGFGFTFAWSRVSSIFVSYWVADLLAAHGTIGVFTLIGAAMVVIILSVGIWGPTTNNRRLEELSP
jgi:MFS transporter, putative metabolite:H+ symporter